MRDRRSVGWEKVLSYLKENKDCWVSKEDIKRATGINLHENMIRTLTKNHMIADGDDERYVMYLGEDHSVSPGEGISDRDPVEDRLLDLDPEFYDTKTDLRKTKFRTIGTFSTNIDTAMILNMKDS